MAKQQLYSFTQGNLYIGNFQLDKTRTGRNYFLTNDKGKIEGISQNVGEYLHVTPKLLLEQEMYIQKLFPDIETDNLMSYEGTKTLQMVSIRKFLSAKPSAKGIIIDKENGGKFDFTNSPKAPKINAKCEITNYSHPLVKTQMKLFSFLRPIEVSKLSSVLYLPCEISNISKIIESAKEFRSSRVNKGIKMPGLRMLSTTEVNSKLEDKEFSQRAPSFLPLNDDEKNPKKTTNCQMIEKIPEIKENEEDIENAESKSKGNFSSKKIETLRNNTYSKITLPAAIRLKQALIAFIFSLSLIIAGRLIVALIVNDRFSVCPPLMMAIGTRLSSIGNLGRYFYTLLLTKQNNPNPYITAETQEITMSYSQYVQNQTNNYTNYTLQWIEQEIYSVFQAELYVNSNSQNFNPDNLLLVDPQNITLNYAAPSQFQSNYAASINSIFYIISSNIMEIVGRAENGESVSPKNQIESFALNTILTKIITAIKHSYEGILQECDDIQSMGTSFSLGLILTLTFIMLFMLIFMAISLTLIHNELVKVLKLLLEIGRVDINNQLNETYSYIKITSLKNINENEEIEQGEDNNLNPEDNNDITEESNLKNHEKEVHIKNRTEKKRSFIPHSNNIWIILIITLLLCGTIMGFFVAYDAYSNLQAQITVFQSDQLYKLTRTLTFNYFVFGYLYQYIVSNKTGYCGDDTCANYINAILLSRMDELNELLLAKVDSESYMSTAYYNLFTNLIEQNPCGTYFPTLPICSTVLGGIATEGIYVANMMFVNNVKSLFDDFTKSNGNTSQIQLYINDKRLIDMETLNNLFIFPAFINLTNMINQDAQYSSLTDKLTTAGAFVALALFLILAIYFGGRWLFGYIRKSLYDAKALLSYLPTDIIQGNAKILQFLEETEKSQQ